MKFQLTFYIDEFNKRMKNAKLSTTIPGAMQNWKMIFIFFCKIISCFVLTACFFAKVYIQELERSSTCFLYHFLNCIRSLPWIIMILLSKCSYLCLLEPITPISKLWYRTINILFLMLIHSFPALSLSL